MHPGACVPQLQRENPHTTTREKLEHCNQEAALQLRPDAAPHPQKKEKKKEKE